MSRTRDSLPISLFRKPTRRFRGLGSFNKPMLASAVYHEAQQRILPTMMTTRIQSWDLPGHEVDPQLACPFYNGRLPWEVTDLILDYVLSPDLSPGSVPYHHRGGGKGKGKEEDGEEEGERFENFSHDFFVRNDHDPSIDEPEVRTFTTSEELHDNDDVNDKNDNNDEKKSASSATANTLPAVWHMGHLPEIPLHLNASKVIKFARIGEVGHDWFRPDYTGLPILPGWPILQTCRRLYLDLYRRLEQSKEVQIFDRLGARSPASLIKFFGLLSSCHDQPQLQRIPLMHLFIQTSNLVSILMTMNSSLTSRLYPHPPPPGTRKKDISYAVEAFLKQCHRYLTTHFSYLSSPPPPFLICLFRNHKQHSRDQDSLLTPNFYFYSKIYPTGFSPLPTTYLRPSNQ